MQPGVCFGAGALWQGGACCCTSVSELSDLCRMGGWGRGWRLHNCVMSEPEREPSGLCHGCRGTPPFRQSHSFSLSQGLAPPRPPTQCFWLLQAVPCCITSALHVSVLYIFPTHFNPPLPLLPLSSLICFILILIVIIILVHLRPSD